MWGGKMAEMLDSTFNTTLDKASNCPRGFGDGNLMSSVC
jgi:hypothetical protein